MRLGPIHALNFRFSNGLVIFALHLHRNGQPLQTLRGLDLVAVTPVAPGILHVVVKNELIHRGDHIEIALPRDVVGLDDGDFFIIRFHETSQLQFKVVTFYNQNISVVRLQLIKLKSSIVSYVAFVQ